MKNNNFSLKKLFSYFTKQKDGELFFQTRILDQYFWISIWINLGEFNEYPIKLIVGKNNIKKSEKYKTILMKSNLKEITTILLYFTIDNYQKIQFIKELSNLFDEPKQ